jgi:hypothetical protein
MVYFQTKKNCLGKFWRTLEGKCWYIFASLEYITASWYSLWASGNSVVIRYVFPRIGILSREKSGNPVQSPQGREKSLGINVLAHPKL